MQGTAGDAAMQQAVINGFGGLGLLVDRGTTYCMIFTNALPVPGSFLPTLSCNSADS